MSYVLLLDYSPAYTFINTVIYYFSGSPLIMFQLYGTDLKGQDITSFKVYFGSNLCEGYWDHGFSCMNYKPSINLRVCLLLIIY